MQVEKNIYRGSNATREENLKVLRISRKEKVDDTKWLSILKGFNALSINQSKVEMDSINIYVCGGLEESCIEMAHVKSFLFIFWGDFFSFCSYNIQH
jgi:hypothetical protein